MSKHMNLIFESACVKARGIFLLIVIWFAAVSNCAGLSLSEGLTLYDLMDFSETRDVVELSNKLIAKEWRLEKTGTENGNSYFQWERYNNESMIIYFIDGYPSIQYSFSGSEEYLSFVNDLKLFHDEEFEDNDFKKLTPEIGDGKIKQPYANNRFYLSFTIYNSTNGYEPEYSIFCRCIMSKDEYLEKIWSDEKIKLYNSRFSAKELVELVNATDKNVVINCLNKKQWRAETEDESYDVTAAEDPFLYPIAVLGYNLDTVIYTSLHFTPAVRLFAVFWSEWDDENGNIYDGGEMFNCFMPNKSDSVSSNVIVCELYRTSQDSLKKDLIRYGFSKVSQKEKLLPPAPGRDEATFCREIRDVYRFEDIEIVIETYGDDNQSSEPQKWYTIYAYNHKNGINNFNR